MKAFYIDFEGYCKVVAETIEEAQEVFWDTVGSQENFHGTYEILGVEEVEEIGGARETEED